MGVAQALDTLDFNRLFSGGLVHCIAHWAQTQVFGMFDANVFCLFCSSIVGGDGNWSLARWSSWECRSDHSGMDGSIHEHAEMTVVTAS